MDGGTLTRQCSKAQYEEIVKAGTAAPTAVGPDRFDPSNRAAGYDGGDPKAAAK